MDMNLSPAWAGFLLRNGIEAIHWSTIGDPTAEDASLMAWAREKGLIVFTHDLDFSAILAATRASGPSVLQVRAQDVLPEAIGEDVVAVLREHGASLEAGAVISIDEVTSRVRVLPIG